MNRTEMIFELAKYMDPVAYTMIVWWSDEVLAALLAYYKATV